uniref:Transducin/WD40 repeat-like superfamily protein n=1 Tax=Caenorhabditis tropicalis TaxID=1561998 RepID=A0A1I7TH10_9PELO
MSHRNSRSRRQRKSRSGKNQQEYPMVSFDGAESVDIPIDEGKSPVKSRMSLASNPDDFNYLDEIALLKRRHISKDAPKHPYNRQPPPPSTSDSSVLLSRSPCPARSPAIMTFMGMATDKERNYKVGEDGNLKISDIKGGGERIEVSTQKQYTVFQQGNGQTCLFTFKN